MNSSAKLLAIPDSLKKVLLMHLPQADQDSRLRLRLPRESEPSLLISCRCNIRGPISPVAAAATSAAVAVAAASATATGGSSAAGSRDTAHHPRSPAAAAAAVAAHDCVSLFNFLIAATATPDKFQSEHVSVLAVAFQQRQQLAWLLHQFVQGCDREGQGAAPHIGRLQQILIGGNLRQGQIQTQRGLRKLNQGCVITKPWRANVLILFATEHRAT